MKVGDRVRVIADDGFIAPELGVGAVGTVGRVDENGVVGVFIDNFREPQLNEGGWSYYPKALELIQ